MNPRIGLGAAMAACLLSLVPGLGSRAAAAAPGTCQGLPATITSDGGTVTGTSGDDVISTTGVVDISALAGNDVICLQVGNVDAGPGNDSVLSTAVGLTSLAAHLGAGDDTFVASHGNNAVDPLPGDSLGKDTITTGDGMDYVRSGEPLEPNLDVVHLGVGGADSLGLTLPPGSDLTADGDDPSSGSGRNTLHLGDPGAPATSWQVDMSGVIRRSGIQVANLSRFQQFGLDLGASTPVTVVGSAGPDHLTLSSGAFDVDLAGGDDSVVVDHDGTVSGRLAAGRGEDGLVARFRSQLLKVHLDTGTFVADSTSLDAVGFERLEGGAPKIRVRGSNAANQISVVGCDVRVEGRGGRDDLNFGDVEELPDCTRTRTVLIGGKGSDLIDGSNGAERLRGGPGNDHLTGSAGKDVLIGGTGRDKTDGGKGKDRCQGEVRTSCET